MSKAVGRPLKGWTKRVRTSFTLPEELVEFLNQTSRKLGIAKSELVERALEFTKDTFAVGEIKQLNHLNLPVTEQQLAKFCEINNIERLLLFGSTSRGEARPDSDIDIAVKFISGKSPSLFKLVELEGTLSRLFGGKKVDLRTYDELSRYFRDAVISNAVPLYG